MLTLTADADIIIGTDILILVAIDANIFKTYIKNISIYHHTIIQHLFLHDTIKVRMSHSQDNFFVDIFDIVEFFSFLPSIML